MRKSLEALHGFAQERTRTTLVSTWQDLKEQDEASKLNHEVLGGLSMRDPQDTPQEREDLVQLGFFPCNPSSSIIL